MLAVSYGVAAIVGAFLAGLALAESTEARERDLAHGVSELLVPFFLAGIGLHVDLSALAKPAQPFSRWYSWRRRWFRNSSAADWARWGWERRSACASGSG